MCGDGGFETTVSGLLPTELHHLTTWGFVGDLISGAVAGISVTTSLSGLVDAQDTGWTSGLYVAFDGTNFVPTVVGFTADNVDGHYEEVFTAINTYTVIHSLDAHPQVTVYDTLTSGEVDLCIQYTSLSGVQLNFNGPLSGTVICDTTSGVFAVSGDGGGISSLSFSGLTDVQDNGWSANDSARFDGDTWIPLNLGTVYEPIHQAAIQMGLHITSGDPHVQYLTEAAAPTLYALSGLFFSQLGDVNTDGWISGNSPRYDGTEWQPIDLHKIYALSGIPGSSIKEYKYTKTLIEEVVLTTTSGAFHIPSIPQTYDHLEYRILARTNNASSNDNGLMEFNGDTTDENYDSVYHRFQGDEVNSSFDEAISIADTRRATFATAASTHGEEFANTVGRIDWYALSGHRKLWKWDSLLEDSNAWIHWEEMGHWDNTDSIQAIKIEPNNGTLWQSGCRLQLFGLRNEEIVTDVIGGVGGGSTNYSGLDDVADTGWTSGLMARYDGNEWVPIDSDETYALSGTIGLGNSTATIQTETVIYEIVYTTTSSGIDLLIPDGYTKLRLEYSARTSSAGTNESLIMYFNGDTTSSNYRTVELWGHDGGGTDIGADGTEDAIFGRVCSNAASAGQFGNGVAHIHNHWNATRFTTVVGYNEARRSDNYYAQQTGMSWETADPVSGLRIQPFANSFLSGTILTLFGSKLQEVVLA
jgi:hypothetical protein